MKKLLCLLLSSLVLAQSVSPVSAMMSGEQQAEPQATRFALVPIFELEKPTLFPEELKDNDLIPLLDEITHQVWNEGLAAFLESFFDDYFCENHRYFITSKASWNVISHVCPDATTDIPQSTPRGTLIMDYLSPVQLKKMVSRKGRNFILNTTPISDRMLRSSQFVIESFCYMSILAFARVYEQIFIHYFNTRAMRTPEQNKQLYKNLKAFDALLNLMSARKSTHVARKAKNELHTIQTRTDPELREVFFDSTAQLNSILTPEKSVSPVDVIPATPEPDPDEYPMCFEMDM